MASWTQVEAKYTQLFRIWTYPEWERWVDEKQNTVSGTKSVIYDIFKGVIACEDTPPALFMLHLYDYLNTKLRDKKFFLKEACNITRVASINFQIIIPKLTSCEVLFTFPSDNEQNPPIIKVNILPFIMESRYFQQLITGPLCEGASRHITLKEVSHKVFSRIYRYMMSRDANELVALIQENAVLACQHLDMWGMSQIAKKMYGIMARAFHCEKSSFAHFYTIVQILHITLWEDKELFSIVKKNVMHFFATGIPIEYFKDLIRMIATSHGDEGRELKSKCFSFVCSYFPVIFETMKNADKTDELVESLTLMQGWVRKFEIPKLTDEQLQAFMSLLSKEQSTVCFQNRVNRWDDIFWQIPGSIQKIVVKNGSNLGDEELKILVKRCPALEEISIHNARITNLGILKPLGNLRVLKLPGAAKIQLETLPILENVTCVNFSYIEIVDFTPLKRLPKLAELVLKGDQPIDIGFLSLIQKFEKLDISGNNRNVALECNGSTCNENAGSIHMIGIIKSEKKKETLSKLLPNCTIYFS